LTVLPFVIRLKITATLRGGRLSFFVIYAIANIMALIIVSIQANKFSYVTYINPTSFFAGKEKKNVPSLQFEEGLKPPNRKAKENP